MWRMMACVKELDEMKKRQSIKPVQIAANIVRIWNDWLILTPGSFADGQFNPMTISWGTMGVMWDKPVVQVVVRPTRHTYGFIEKAETFTVCAFPAQFKQALTLCGTKSGRDIDKVKEAGLTPIASSVVAAPGYEEASLIIECRKLAFGDHSKAGFVEESIDSNYNGDYHRWYLGEMVAVSATDDYILV